MRIAIIGAGAAGLPCAKYALDEGFECEVLEQTGSVGGTWNYTDRIYTDENDLPLQTSMYNGLRTNLPKEVMTYLDFPYPKQNKSFIYQSEVLEYMKSYEKKYNLSSVIKFYKQVTKVEPSGQNKWCITTKDAKTKEEELKQFDAVMVCNGHYFDPFIPDIKGKDCFKGNLLHSKFYRIPDSYKDKVVLLIGAGPSGIDIGRQIAKVANKVLVSDKHGCLKKHNIGLISKGLVKEIFEDSVQFEGENDKEMVDAILFCTGYNYYFPFLSEKCKVTVENNQVKPLFKHMINIEHPTMAFIGLLFQICPFPLFDIQARFFMETLKNPTILPPKQLMYEDFQRDINEQLERELPQNKFHYCGEKYQPIYFNSLTELSGVKPIPHVINKIFCKNKCNQTEENFEIIDDDNFTVTN